MKYQKTCERRKTGLYRVYVHWQQKTVKATLELGVSRLSISKDRGLALEISNSLTLRKKTRSKWWLKSVVTLNSNIWVFLVQFEVSVVTKNSNYLMSVFGTVFEVKSVTC